jgi:hypothetical protein
LSRYSAIRCLGSAWLGPRSLDGRFMVMTSPEHPRKKVDPHLALFGRIQLGF